MARPRYGFLRRTVVFAVTVSTALATQPAGIALALSSDVTLNVQLQAPAGPFVDHLTNALAVAPGTDITVRLTYDNRMDRAGTDARIQAMIPAGFTLLPGTTKNCLHPTDSETLCNTSPGQMGPIVEQSVWNGSFLAISPTAGVEGVPPHETIGVLEMGRLHYLTLRSEGVANYENGNPYSPLNTRCAANISSRFENPYVNYAVPTSPTCPASGRDLFGQRWFIVRSEAVANYENGNPQPAVDTSCILNISSHFQNTPVAQYAVPGNPSCPSYSQDTLGKRYYVMRSEAVANYENGNFQDPDMNSCAINISSYFTNTPVATYAVPRNPSCPSVSHDLLDRTRGRGYIEFRMRASTVPGIYNLPATITGSEFTAASDAGAIEIRGPGTSSSSSSSSSPTASFGCIRVIKQTLTSAGAPFTSPEAFSFWMDGNQGISRTTDGSGTATFTNVAAPGMHHIDEFAKPGWFLQSVSPAGGDVMVQPGSSCAVVTFVNRQGASSSSSSSTPLFQCNDGADNDGDGKIDSQDPGCHSDGNAANPASYVSTDNDEANPAACIPGNQPTVLKSQFIITPNGYCSNAWQSQMCANQLPVDFVLASSTPSLLVQYHTYSGHCSSVRIHIRLDGILKTVTRFMGWPTDSTGFLDIGPVPAGNHQLTFQAEGTPGGCNTGTLGGWGGTVNIALPAQSCPVAPQCSDAADNDGDGKIDSQDPGCHSDGNAANPASYVPTGNDEFNAAASSSSSSSSTASTGVGCIRIVKQAQNAAGAPINSTEPFTFTLDGNPSLNVTTDANGNATFQNVAAPGIHTVAELSKSGWTLQSMSPANGEVLVQPGGNCAVLTVVNRQTGASSSSSSSSIGQGCIKVFKETYNASGQPIATVAQFTFVLDGGVQIQNDANGNAQFNAVSTGVHTVTEVLPQGWNQLNVTPASGVVIVSPGSQCAGVVFKNQQTLPVSSSVANANTGCIRIVKQTVTSAGAPITPVEPFTFILDGNPSLNAVNDASGTAIIQNVAAPGMHQITETPKAGWTVQSMSPVNGDVMVQPGSACATLTIVNRKTGG